MTVHRRRQVIDGACGQLLSIETWRRETMVLETNAYVRPVDPL